MDKVFTENDWRLFRTRIVQWQERYMEQLNQEYISLLSGDGTPSDRFWALEKRIKEDKLHVGVCIDMRRSVLVHNLIMLLRCNVISEADLDGFSDCLKSALCFAQSMNPSINE